LAQKVVSWGTTVSSLRGDVAIGIAIAISIAISIAIGGGVHGIGLARASRGGQRAYGD